MQLSPLTAGSAIALRNIFFNTASAELLPAEQRGTGQVLLRLMKANPDMRIEVGGHTDNVGADADNQKLSEQRADGRGEVPHQLWHRCRAGHLERLWRIEAGGLQRYGGGQGAEPPHGDNRVVDALRQHTCGMDVPRSRRMRR